MKESSPKPDSTCKKCGGEMKQGVALKNTYTGTPDFAGGPVVTMSYGGPGELIKALKCVDCGWSVTTEEKEHETASE